MKILNLCSNDYACFSHDNSNALRSVGVDCTDIVLHPHKFEYPSQSTLVQGGAVKHYVQQADIVQIFHSDPVCLELVLAANPKRIVCHHTGTRYRQDPDKYNAMFNPHVDISFIALGEFAGLGAKNEIYSVGAIDTDRLKPTKTELSDPLSIMHLPSSPAVKGTDKIIEMMSNVTGSYEFEYKLDTCSYADNLELMRQCDVYIELFASEQNGKPYGSWGITALEAAALGKVVVTQHLSKQVYFDTYGIVPELGRTINESDFTDKVQSLVNYHSVTRHLQKVTRDWVVKYHSYQATGHRLKKIFSDLLVL